MELFIKTTAFNKGLLHQAVSIEGRDVDGNHISGVFIVTEVDQECIRVTNGSRNYYLHRENFDNELLSITSMVAHEILNQK